MSGGLLLVADAISEIGDAAVAASAALKQTLADQQAVNAAKQSGSAPHLGTTTATNEGYGPAGNLIAALNSLEGRRP
jgi:hypothetical protein